MDERPISVTGLNYKIFAIIYYLWSSKTYTDKRPLGYQSVRMELDCLLLDFTSRLAFTACASVIHY